MVPITMSYEGQLRVTSTHGPSGVTLSTDAPADNHGRGETFSPTDLVATALASCMITTMGIVAERDGLDLTRMTARVEKHMIVEPVRRIGRLPVTITFKGNLPEPQRKKLERVALKCPVHQSLHPDIEIPVTFEWNPGF